MTLPFGALMRSRSSLITRSYLEKMLLLIEHHRYYALRLRQLPHQILRLATRRTCRGYSTIEPFITGKCGLEIGGPSPIFREGKLIPVYGRCSQMDHCNYSSETIWSDTRSRGRFVVRGKQYVAEACDLSVIPDGTYNFVAASHVLEHLTNPLRALQEWKRVLAPGGALLVVVPDKRTTFDRKRPFTTFEHLQRDFQANTPEDDPTHLKEILEFHDLGLDPLAGSALQFRERCMKNASIRAMHHHVFSPEVLILMFNFLQMRVLNINIERPYHIVAFAQKLDQGDDVLRLSNLDLLDDKADWRRHDPFRKSPNAVENRELS
jgi:SAM-dependent methyltransferase